MISKQNKHRGIAGRAASGMSADSAAKSGPRGRTRSVAFATISGVALRDSSPSRAPAPKPAPKSGHKPASDVLAGALARAMSQSTIHPIDTIKVRMQSGSGSGFSKFSRLVPPAGAVGGVKDALGRALPGVASLYSGVLGAASGAGVAIGAYFACYGAAHNAIGHAFPAMQPGAVAFFAGAAAAAGSSVVKVPIAVCIRSVQAGRYPNAMQACSSIVAKAGLGGLFTGFLPTVLEDIPDMAFKFAAYESLKQVHRQVRGQKASPQEDFAMGAVAGAFAAAATTPLDVVKTNMMVNASQRPGMMQAAANVLASGGPRAFLKGIGPRAISNGINSAVFFCFFEALSRLFKDVSARRAAAAQARAARPSRVAAGRPAHRPARRAEEAWDSCEGEPMVLTAQPASISVARRHARRGDEATTLN